MFVIAGFCVESQTKMSLISFILDMQPWASAGMQESILSNTAFT